MCVCVSTASGVCALGRVKYREHISLLVILCINVCETKKKNIFKPIMVKCLNIGKNIASPAKHYWGIWIQPQFLRAGPYDKIIKCLLFYFFWSV